MLSSASQRAVQLVELRAGHAPARVARGRRGGYAHGRAQPDALHARADVADGVARSRRSTVFALGSYGQTVSSSTYQTSWPSAAQPAQPVEVQPRLPAERAAAHHPENDDQPETGAHGTVLEPRGAAASCSAELVVVQRRVRALRAQQLARAGPARRCGRRRARRCGRRSRMVDSRWAMTKVVRPAIRRSQRLEQQRLGARVQRGGRLVEDQDRRVLEEGAGDGQPLPLAAGQRRARARPPPCRSRRAARGRTRRRWPPRAAAAISLAGGVRPAVGDVLGHA